MAEIDIEKLLAEAGIKQTPGVDDCYVLTLDQIESVAALVLEEAAKVCDAPIKTTGGDGVTVIDCTFIHCEASPHHAAAIRTIAEGLKP